MALATLAPLALPDDTHPVEAEDFRDILARLASGLAIAACWDGVRPVGLLLSSITGLSVEPPQFLFCVRRAASAYSAFAAAEVCSLSLLSVDQHDEAAAFASSDRAADRFHGAAWRFEASAPRLVGGLASIVGRLQPVYEAAGHTVFVFTAERIETLAGQPLIYVDRRFAGASALP